MTKLLRPLFLCLFIVTIPLAVYAQQPSDPATIPAGTIITMANWQQYQQFMSEGLTDLFAGKFYWKIPSDVAIEVGPTIVHPLPKGYLAATEKYGSQVRIVELADGGLTMSGYQGGLPFPAPTEPHKGWKVLANVWYRYVPHLSVISEATGCTLTSGGTANCTTGNVVYRQLSYNTDPGIPTNTPGFENDYFTQWFMILEPEQLRYTASLTIAYNDLAKEQDLYAFIPSLRRYQAVSTYARCGQNSGLDINTDDYRSGFNSNLTQLKVDYVGSRKVLGLILDKMPPTGFPDDFEMPLGWPKPSWGKWQVRDVDVISMSKLPAHATGYCYGKRVMYVDRQSSTALWEELYDTHLQLWRIAALYLHTVDVPGIGPVDSSGSVIYSFWDVINNHASFVLDPINESHPFYVNEQVPKDFVDLPRYSTPSGLNMIMR